MISYLHLPKAKLAVEVPSAKWSSYNPHKSLAFALGIYLISHVIPDAVLILFSIFLADLLSIVVRTIILVRRNRILHGRLNALRAETRRFLRSVLNNPENQQRRSQVPSHLEDSSSTEKIVSTLSPLLPADPTKNSFQITSRGNCNHTNDESSSSDKSEASRSDCWFFNTWKLLITS